MLYQVDEKALARRREPFLTGTKAFSSRSYNIDGRAGRPCRDRLPGSANFLDRSQNGWGASHRWTGSRILARAVEDGSPLDLWRSRVFKAQSKPACRILVGL